LLINDGPVYHAVSVHLCRSKLIARLTIDMQWHNFLSAEFGTKFQEEVPLFVYMPEFPYKIVQDRSKEAYMPKTSSIRQSISTEHRLVTDRRGHSVIASTRARIASRG